MNNVRARRSLLAKPLPLGQRKPSALSGDRHKAGSQDEEGDAEIMSINYCLEADGNSIGRGFPWLDAFFFYSTVDTLLYGAVGPKRLDHVITGTVQRVTSRNRRLAEAERQSVQSATAGTKGTT